MRLSKLLLLPLVAAALVPFGPPSVAHADSGRFQLHLDLGAGVPVTGPTNRRSSHSNDRPAGGVGWIGADFQLAAPIALEVIVGFGAFNREFPESRSTAARIGHGAIGARFRFLDDQSGYNNEEGGNLASNLWLSAHIGYADYDKAQFAIDFGGGYEISVVRPLQLGVFTRAVLMLGGRHDSVDMIIVAGLSVGLELVGTARALDSDGDGLPDERELALGTDPHDRDTDGDLISDAIEVETDTDPLDTDTDHDGLNDGREDNNQNGVLDDGESDPRRGDTDGGGMPDADEVRSLSQDPQFAGDDDLDSDGVPNNMDQCANSPEGEEVNVSGCPIVPETFTLEGVRFESGSATLLPESTSVLEEALVTLRRSPTERYLIAGHTDSQGRPAANQELSQRRAEAVLRWLVEHGLDSARFEVRGFGQEEPIDTNETEEGRAHNRRIEFRHLTE